ncbi:MAG: response regulator transcription factor [Melioribacteraceae bacterium]
MNFAITCILQRLNDFEVFGVSSDEIFEEILKYEPHLLICEVEESKDESCNLIEKIRQEFPNLKILVLVDFSDRKHISELLKYKLEGYLLKNTTKDELIIAAKKIHKGEKYYSKRIYEYVMNNFDEEFNKQKHEIFDELLSIREKEILQHIVLGKKNKEIGKTFFISENTVLTHRRNIMKKLNVKSTPELIVTSIRNGIITFKNIS